MPTGMFCVLFCALFFSCRASVMDSGTDTATIRLTIPTTLSTGTGTAAAASGRAVFGYTGDAVSVTVSGSDFSSFTKTFYAVNNIYTAVVDVPKGSARKFTVHAADTADTVYAEGSTTADITDTVTSLTVTLAPVADIAETYDPSGDDYSDTADTNEGVVKVVSLNPSEGMSLIITASNVHFKVAETDGTVLPQPQENDNTYTYTLETNRTFYVLYTPENSSDYSISISLQAQ